MSTEDKEKRHSNDIKENRLLRRLELLLQRYEPKSSETYTRLVTAFNALKTGCPATIKRVAFEGLPEHCPALRAVYWRVLLGYLPINAPFAWTEVLDGHRTTYLAVVDTLVWKRFHVRYLKSAIEQDGTLRALQAAMACVSSEDEQACPVSEPDECSKKSQTTAAGKGVTVDALTRDIGLLDQINKDVCRTRADEGVLKKLLRPSCRKDVEKLGANETCSNVIDIFNPVKYCDLFGRILFIYSKLHPSTDYTQGMNELLAPLFCVIFEEDTDDDPDVTKTYLSEQNIQQKESDVFFCFSLLLQMNGHYELFCRTFDKDRRGVLGRVKHFTSLLHLQDPGLYFHLRRIRLDPQFFVLRWILLLFAQEFPLPQVLRFWDSFLAENETYMGSEHQLYYFVCLSVLSELRRQLLVADFSNALQLLQNLPPWNPEQLISSAVGHRCVVQRRLAEGLVDDVCEESFEPTREAI